MNKKSNKILCLGGEFNRRYKELEGRTLRYIHRGTFNAGYYNHEQYGHKGEIKDFYIDSEEPIYNEHCFTGTEQYILEHWEVL